MQRQIPEQAASLHIRSVVLWTNGMVMVFNDQGEQMPAYQGYFEGMSHSINNVFSGIWEYGDWRAGIISGYPIRDEK